ncbi:histidine phosphatase family protein [Georgenia yuyongxinii]|uniref:Histidine phosphatase family protein n=1 Tax=Georgenia yuyongxinii TaxID=2589797 RepID=A0A552WV12_9MICO|nr:histidine phosphatase family protein [Georgenia yuyongxinii]TRW46680.1 histidine phosphatase family protein [Georgenia yuyongxinii]
MSEDNLVPVAQRLLLLRHGEIASHRGDVPLTAQGRAIATDVGRHLGATEPVIRVLTGDTRRARETAEAIADGARSAGATVSGPREAFALRNPDLYLAGERVNMVSSAAAFAAQVEGLDEDAAARAPFFAGFLTAADRIGWWLQQHDVPGDDAPTVARRVTHFAASLADLPRPGLTVAVTHSPVLRACAVGALGSDPGEPAWVAGLRMDVRADRTVVVTALPDAPAAHPAHAARSVEGTP